MSIYINILRENEKFLTINHNSLIQFPFKNYKNDIANWRIVIANSKIILYSFISYVYINSVEKNISNIILTWKKCNHRHMVLNWKGKSELKEGRYNWVAMSSFPCAIPTPIDHPLFIQTGSITKSSIFCTIRGEEFI